MIRLKSSQIQMAAVVSVALALRLLGIGFGLPLVSNFYIRPDETLVSVSTIKILENSGNPHFFSYPALFMEINAIFYQIRFVLLKMLGIISAPSVSADFGFDMSGYVTITRCLSAVFSALTVILVYKLSRKIVNEHGSVLAALLLAISPLACRDAHYGVTDSLVTFCGAACIYTLAGYVETGKRTTLYMASILLGFALSAKYCAATIFPILLLAVLFNGNASWRMEKIKQLAIVAILPLLVFLMFNPFVIQESRSFLGSLRLTVGTLYYNHQSSLPIITVINQALTPLKYGPAGILCIPLMLASLFFISNNSLSRKITWLVVAAFILAFLPVISTKHSMPYRYVLPALPYSAILVMLGIRVITRERDVAPSRLVVAGWNNIEQRQIVYAGFILVTLIPTLISCIWTDVLLSRPDSRTLAGEWISENITRDIPIVIAGWPECEPQVSETDLSILRRIDFVRRFYGESAVPIITQPYFMQLCSSSYKKRSGYELYRIAVPADIPGDKICLVIPTYPYTGSALRTADISHLLGRFKGRITEKTKIETLHNESIRHDFDPIDAFYLPVDSLSNVVRPGPSMNIYLIDRNMQKAK